MTPIEVGLLGIAALATSVLSAVIGMAGGATLLAVMLLLLDPLEAIPLHGVIQLVSNCSRTAIQRRHVEWHILTRFSLLLVPAGMLGLALAQRLPPDAGRVTIGLFVLLATWLPLERLAMPATRGRFVALGGVVGFLSPSLGATGPLLAPFFLDLGLPRQGIVGTKAACQVAVHAVKIALFGAAGFAFLEHAPLLALLCACVVAGSWLGSRLLDHVSERGFLALYRGVLTLVALRLVLGSLA